jgi:hypothetical protein
VFLRIFKNVVVLCEIFCQLAYTGTKQTLEKLTDEGLDSLDNAEREVGVLLVDLEDAGHHLVMVLGSGIVLRWKIHMICERTVRTSSSVMEAASSLASSRSSSVTLSSLNPELLANKTR